MSQFRKNNCAYHPDQLITNFCRDSTCLMPLCPYCIGQHSQYHQNQGTKPLYSPISQAFMQVKTKLENLIFSLQQDKKRNNQIIIQIQNLPKIVRQKILIAKNLAYNIIDQSFIQLQKDILNSLKKYQQQQNIYSIKKCQNYDDNLKQKIDDLYHMVNGLKGQKNLSHLIHFHKEINNQINNFHTQITNYLYINQNYTPSIEISQDAPHSLSAVICRMLRTDHKQGINYKDIKQNQYIDGLDRKGSRYMHSYVKTQKNLTPRSSQKSSRLFQRIVTQQHDNSPYKSKANKNATRYQNIISSEIKQYRNQYQNISQKVSDVRKENQALSKMLRYN